MGIKTVAGLTFTAEHHAAAAKLAHDIAGLQRGITLKLAECINDLRLLVSQMPAGDGNIVSINAAITKLS